MFPFAWIQGERTYRPILPGAHWRWRYRPRAAGSPGRAAVRFSAENRL